MSCTAEVEKNSPELLSKRKAEIGAAVATLDALLKKRRVKAVVGPQGAITFVGDEWASVRNANRISDACAYRKIMATGSSLAKAEIARAEAMAGRTVDRKVVASGLHSHDGQNWETH